MRLNPLRRSLFKAAAQRSTTGIFGNARFQKPSDFSQEANSVVVGSEELIKQILLPYEQRATKKTSVQLLDDLSNKICVAADLTECVRNMHPDPEYRTAGDNAMRIFTDLVESLNTMPALYNSVKTSLESERSLLDKVDRRTIQLFLDDFEQCGVHLDKKLRREFVALSNKIFELSMQFCAQADRLPHTEYTRHDPEQELTLRSLVEHRQRLAQLTGFDSFADRAQQHTILEDYNDVDRFLTTVVKNLNPLFEEELENIRRLLTDAKHSPTHELNEWDIELAIHLEQRNLHNKFGDLSRFLSFGQVLLGFSSLCEHIYGLRFQLSRANNLEVWPGCVAKLSVYRGHDFVGTIYVDGETRASKTIGDCHYTVQCSKLMEDNTYQKPVVVLSLSLFDGPAHHVDLPQLFETAQLRPRQAENLWHELGHAIHSMLGATRYQHVAGTRCPTDFAEVPSNVKEYFFNDTRVLRTIPADPDNQIDDAAALAIHRSLNICPVYAILQQVLYGLFDLRLHHDRNVFRDGTSTDMYRDLCHDIFPQIRIPRDYAYHHRMTHLVTYGAKYYSYIIARACASQIWHQKFAADPFNEVGGREWAGVQALGGERPSAELLQRALGKPLSAQDLADSLTKDCLKVMKDNKELD